MNKADLRKLLDELLKDVPEDAQFVLGIQGELQHNWELQPRVVCGGRERYTALYCIKPPGHTGRCYCNSKSTYFDKDC